MEYLLILLVVDLYFIMVWTTCIVLCRDEHEFWPIMWHIFFSIICAWLIFPMLISQYLGDLFIKEIRKTEN